MVLTIKSRKNVLFSFYLHIIDTTSSISKYEGLEPDDDNNVNLAIFAHGSTSKERKSKWTVPPNVRIVFFYDPYSTDKVVCAAPTAPRTKEEIELLDRWVLEPGQTYKNLPRYQLSSDPNGGVFSRDGEVEFSVLSESLFEAGKWGGQYAPIVIDSLTTKLRALKSNNKSMGDTLITYYMYMCGARDDLRAVTKKVIRLGGRRRSRTRKSRR
jgi:hypothetical protein